MVRFNLGNVLLKKGDFLEARALFDEANRVIDLMMFHQLPGLIETDRARLLSRWWQVGFANLTLACLGYVSARATLDLLLRRKAINTEIGILRQAAVITFPTPTSAPWPSALPRRPSGCQRCFGWILLS